MDILIPSAFGTEAVVKRQLYKLGYPDTVALDGKVSLCGDWNDVARLNVFLRSGERVLIKLATFNANTFDDVYDNVFRVRWFDYMDKNAHVLVDVKSSNSVLGAIKAIGGVMKKAIMNSLYSKYKIPLDENGDRYVVGLYIKNDVATLTLDTSGEGLHKRGYRTLAYSAPLKETLAATLIDLTVYNKDKQFADLFCGSGTLPIEACLKALNIAPGKNRNFDFENWKNIDKNCMKKAKEEALDCEIREKIKVFAYDINKNAISIARYHAKNAGVEEYIHFQASDMREFSSSKKYGVICSNPPYGERLGEEKEVLSLYRDLGKLVSSLPDWNAYILTSHPMLEACYGRNADKRRKLFNANIQCCFYSFMSKKPEMIKE